MARTKLTTVEAQPVKSTPVPTLTPAPIPKAKVNFKKTVEPAEETRLAPKGVTETRERKLMAEPVYEQGDGVTKKTISQRSVILGPNQSTPTAQAQPQARAQPMPRAPTPQTRSALVADARAEQARTITDVKASTVARQKCSQSCQEQFRNNAAMLGECLANCI